MPDDPVLLITGASSGIGAATARAAAANYRLVLAARRLQELETLATELGGPERALAVRCDRLLRRGTFPGPRGQMPAFPWPFF